MSLSWWCLCVFERGRQRPSVRVHGIARPDEPVCPAGSEAAKQQRPPVADAEEKKSQISADSGLSVMSGSQVCRLVGRKDHLDFLFGL